MRKITKTAPMVACRPGASALAASGAPTGSRVAVSVKVTNTGARAGKEVVQLYLSELVASVTPPGKRLVRFAKIKLEPHASRTLSFTLRAADLSFIDTNNKDTNNKPVVESGDFEVAVGGLHARFNLKP